MPVREGAGEGEGPRWGPDAANGLAVRPAGRAHCPSACVRQDAPRGGC